MYVELFVPYNLSRIWDFHYQFYENKGIAAWTKGSIPYVSTNSLPMATQQAQMVCALYKNALRRREILPDAPYYVLEVGCGTGLFAANFLTALQTKCGETGRVLFKNIQYLLSDYHHKTVTDALSADYLAPHLSKVIPTLCDLRDANLTTLDGTKLAIQPSVVFANYICCISKSKRFKIENGVLYEQYVHIELTNAEFQSKLHFATQSNSVLSSLPLATKWVAFNEADTDLDDFDVRVLSAYAHKNRHHSFYYPLQFIRFLRQLQSRLTKPGHMLISDFGFAATDTSQRGDTEERFFYGNTLNHSVEFALLEKVANELSWSSLCTTAPLRSVHHAYLSNAPSLSPLIAAAFYTHIETCYDGENLHIFQMLAEESLSAGMYERCAYFAARCIELDGTNKRQHQLLAEAMEKLGRIKNTSL